MAPIKQTREAVVRGAEVAPGVRRFDDGIVNWYLIEADGRLTAVDAGFPTAWRALTETLVTLGLEIGSLDAVILTHAHVDHLGFAEQARQEAGATVHVHDGDARLAGDPMTIAKSERSPFRYVSHAATRNLLLQATLARAPLAKGVKELHRFSDGDVLDVPGRPHAVHTPGHTDGHCVFHLPERGVLFSGDAVVTRDPYTGVTGPQTVSRAATRDAAKALSSLDRLRDLDATLLLPGHGDPWHGSPAEAARLAREAGIS